MFTSVHLYSQNQGIWNNYGENEDGNFYEQLESFRLMTDTLTPGNETHEMKKFARHAWFWDSRVFNDESNDASYSKYHEYLATQLSNGFSCASEADWQEIGPLSYNHVRRAADNDTELHMSHVTSMYMDPVDPSYILSGPSGSGVWETTNGGDNWQSITDNLRIPGLIANQIIKINGQNKFVFATGVEAYGRGEDGYGPGLVLYDRDNGTVEIIEEFRDEICDILNLECLGYNLPVCTAMEWDPDFGYVVAIDDMILKSSDLISWENITPPWEDYNIDPDANNFITTFSGDNPVKNKHNFIDIEFMHNSTGDPILFVSSKNKNTRRGGAQLWRFDGLYWTDLTNNFGIPTLVHDDPFTTSQWSNNSAPPWSNFGTLLKCEPGASAESSIYDNGCGGFNAPGRLFFENVYRVKIDTEIPKGANLFIRPTDEDLNPEGYIPLTLENGNWLNEGEYATTDVSIDEEFFFYYRHYGCRLELVVQTNGDYVSTSGVQISDFGIHAINPRMIQIDVAPDGDALFATHLRHFRTKNMNIYKSEDFGDTWTFVRSSAGDFGDINKHDFAVVSSDPVDLYIGGIELSRVYSTPQQPGVLSQVDITETTGGVHLHDDIRYLEVLETDGNGNHTVLVGCDGGNAVSYDSGETWENLNGEYFPTIQFYGVGTSERHADRYIGGCIDNQTYIYDDGIWFLVGRSDGTDSEISDADPDILYGSNWGAMRYWEIDENGEIPDDDGEFIANWGKDLKTPFAEKHGQLYWGGEFEIGRYDGVTVTELDQLNPNANEHIHPKGSFSGLAISDLDDDKIYVGCLLPTWNDPIEKRLYRTLDGGMHWQDLTSAHPAFKWQGVSDIELDPDDDDKGYVSFSGITDQEDGTFKVLRFDIDGSGNITFEDWSEGLSGLPINALSFQKDARIVYCADDIGVYYRYASDPVGGDGWQCYSNGLPPAIITDIDVNLCASELVCSTFGRGFWKTKLIPQADFIVNTTEVWSGTTEMYTNIRIASGSDLTITGTLNMASDKHIYIERGGRLTIDGGTVTNACERFWNGIYVEGDVTTNQDDFANKGYLRVFNGGTISNAKIGVHNYGLTSNGNTDWNTTGGIIYCEDGNFINNWKSVQFLSYQNFSVNSQTGEQIPKVDRSNFKRCNFEINDKLVDGETHDAHVSMYKVDGIGYSGCEFTNLRSNADVDGEDRGQGIRSINATYYITADCPVTNPDCDESELIRSKFEELATGIDAMNFDDFYTVEVNRADFINNHRGIAFSAVNNASLTQNTFSLTEEPGYEAGDDDAIGIFIRGCTGYEVEDNTFNALAGPGYFTGGIVVHQSGPHPNEIYRNFYSNLYVGTLVQGQNRNFADNTGLEILCGSNTANEFDISLDKLGSQDGSHALEQGEAIVDETGPAGNNFSSQVCIDENSLYAEPNAAFYIYNHHEDNDYQPQVGCYTPGVVFPIEVTGNLVSNFDDACPSRLSREEGSEDPLGRAMESRSASDSLQLVYDQLADAGDTQSLLTLINSGANSYTIRTGLLDNSPNLSDTTLNATIRVQPALNEWYLTEVMIANSPLSLGVYHNYMGLTTIPQFFKDLLDNYQSGTSTLGALSSDIRSKESGEWVNSSDFIRTILLRDTSLFRGQDILDLVENLSENRAIKTTVATLASLGEFTEARTKLAEYTSSSNDAYPVVQEMVLDMLELNQLPDTNDMVTLENIANSTQLGRYRAQNMLTYLRGDDFPDEVIWPTPGPKSLIIENRTEVELEEAIRVFPNPAKDVLQIAFLYGEEFSELQLFIHDIQGKLVYSKQTGNFGLLDNINVSDFADGSYVLTLWSGELQLGSKRFVVENE